MAASILPQKRVLGESRTRQNIPATPSSAKKRRTDIFSSSPAAPPSSQNALRGKLGSSQPKSAFETDVLEKLSQDISELKKHNSEKDQVWDRPPLVDFVPERDSLCFQSIEAERGVFDGSESTVTLFGVTMEGYSVMLHVMDFKHYLYIHAPVLFQPEDCAGYKAFLEMTLAESKSAIHSVNLVSRQDIYGYHGDSMNPFLKITVTDQKYIFPLRRALQEGQANWKNMWKVGSEGLKTYDNVEYVLRFMIDCKIQGMSWVEAPAAKYQLIPHEMRQSNCQIEAKVKYSDLIAHEPKGEWAKMAPLRVLSMDIECAGRKGIFPDADYDPVIQIANVVTKYGEKKPFVRNVFCLDTTSSITATQILDYDNEKTLLREWQKFLLRVDPDIIIGYNTSNFDFPYLLDRAKALKVDGFDRWARLPHVRCKPTDSKFGSKQLGNRETKSTKINGRLQLDLLQLIQRDHHLRSYTLNSVCSHFLGEQKEDVHHTMITELFNGTPESRRRLALYCLKDAYLPQKLMDKLSCLENYTEMARVTGVPFNYLLARGQQIKFISQLFRKALEQQLVIPDLASNGSDDQYVGATVIEPKRGYYKAPIATLDFASLYPSIIQAHNLCYTTLLTSDAIKKFNLKKDEDYIVTPNNDCFVTTKRRKGLLAQILAELLAARKQAKRELAVETDPFKKAVLNGRQLALKISANSVYGLTGATNGKLPCLAIASSTTSFGRQMIEKTRDEVQKRFTIANGYSHDAEVIYGDTDSVMIKFGTEDLAEAMKMGQEAAQFVSSQFLQPIKLEFEKVYYPYLLINKKRYAGLYWTKTEKYDKMDTKGIETVRRDNCMLVQTVIEKVLRMILIDRDETGAQEYVKRTIADLLQNKIDMSKLVITKALTKDDYEHQQAHTAVAERMKERDKGSAPGLGDRVAYVMVRSEKGAKNFEKSEDPLYVLEHNVPIDTKYYLDNQLAKPLARIFDAILGGENKSKSLLTGEHTRVISVASPTVGGLMKFAKKTQQCLGCKRPMPSKEGQETSALCQDCIPRAGELYQHTLNKVTDLEVRFGRLWTQCQRCQGSMHCEVICSSKDCPIFYMRMKAKKDIEDAGKELVRFDAAELW
ncbi:DNA polymerase delta, catalytic subunit [Stachybotrys elegans]|uniref:DNA polymerase n=1 Tax=Stachybotrys elegans TaxID=80388 RepID=A0A8K0SV44_9HYPO|nr:DNA polymerase delta, catalytic subunit [Stachybotrys elegans]